MAAAGQGVVDVRALLASSDEEEDDDDDDDDDFGLRQGGPADLTDDVVEDIGDHKAMVEIECAQLLPLLTCRTLTPAECWKENWAARNVMDAAACFATLEKARRAAREFPWEVEAAPAAPAATREAVETLSRAAQDFAMDVLERMCRAASTAAAGAGKGILTRQALHDARLPRRTRALVS